MQIFYQRLNLQECYSRLVHFSRKILFLSILILLLGLAIYFFVSSKVEKQSPAAPQIINVGGLPKVKYPQDYTIVLLGDSMTETLGNSVELKEFLSSHYPGKTFEVLNYGFGATNILSVMDRITKETDHGRKFRPISEIEYDLILLESFGQNPLSEYGLGEGLKRQSEELDKIADKLKATNPEGKIVFVATISPNKRIFAKNQVDLSDEKRIEWVDERIAYIKNHIAYANSHNIPVINIFEKSRLDNGDGNPDYISREIADFIYLNNIFPY